MRLVNFSDQSVIAAAQGRIDGARWRAAMGVLFFLAAGFALQSLLAPLVWAVVYSACAAVDYYLARRLASAANAQQRDRVGPLFFLACVLTHVAFTSIVVWVGVFGGDAGRTLSVLIAACSIVSALLFLNAARFFMLAIIAPTVLWLVAAPFAPIAASPSGPTMSAAALSIGVLAFLLYAARAAWTNSKLVDGLSEATRLAQAEMAAAEGKRAEAERANRAKSEFLTTMTHELRTPLNAVIGYSEIIGEDMEAEGHPDLAADARRINSAGRHLLGLIDQILQLSSIDAERSALELADVNVRELIESAVTTMTPAAQANNNRIAVRIAADISKAHTDGERLGVCISQMLSNAVKFTNDGLVAVSVDREGASAAPWLRIAVSDTGIGMAAEELERAFQPFTQVDASKTRAQGGMGLGLSIAMRAAQALGGEIMAVSEPGAGSTFTLRIPMNLGVTAGHGEQSGGDLVRDLGAAA